MEIETLASIAGVLGFFISIATFILTRIERRKKVIVELYKDNYYKFCNTDGASLISDDEIIKIRATNIGGKSVIVNPETFFIKGNGETIKTYNTDWLNIESIPSPLQAGSSFEVGIFKSAFEELLKLKASDKYSNTNEYKKTTVLLDIGFNDHTGKTFKTDNFNYFYYVGEIERNT